MLISVVPLFLEYAKQCNYEYNNILTITDYYLSSKTALLFGLKDNTFLFLTLCIS